MSEQQKQALNSILTRVYTEELNPFEGVLEADRQIGGITGVIFKVGLTLANHIGKISAQRKGLGRREVKKLEEFATLAYWKAQQNGSIRPGEVRLEKGISTKHYKGGFQVYQNQLLNAYAR